jgi:hypothetical protein
LLAIRRRGPYILLFRPLIMGGGGLLHDLRGSLVCPFAEDELALS